MQESMVNSLRKQVFLGLFFVLWMGNCVLAHVAARPFVERAQVAHTIQAAGGDPAEVAPGEDQVAQGAGLLVVNLPLFVGLGVIVRQDPPETGKLYWSLVVLGSTYIPLFLTLCVFFFFHPPKGRMPLPGVMDDDEYLADEEDDDVRRK